MTSYDFQTSLSDTNHTYLQVASEDRESLSTHSFVNFLIRLRLVKTDALDVVDEVRSRQITPVHVSLLQRSLLLVHSHVLQTAFDMRMHVSILEYLIKSEVLRAWWPLIQS